jgi:hypothetical protein
MRTVGDAIDTPNAMSTTPPKQFAGQQPQRTSARLDNSDFDAIGRGGRRAEFRLSGLLVFRDAPPGVAAL